MGSKYDTPDRFNIIFPDTISVFGHRNNVNNDFEIVSRQPVQLASSDYPFSLHIQSNGKKIKMFSGPSFDPTVEDLVEVDGDLYNYEYTLDTYGNGIVDDFRLEVESDGNTDANDNEIGMSKNMTFIYEKTPKFCEQETGHVYFNTSKGETRELIFEGNVSFGYSGCDGQHLHAPLDGLNITDVDADYLVVDFAGKENILYKILAADIEPELNENYIDRIPYVFGPVKGTHVTYMDYSEGVYHNIYKTEDEYPLCAVVPYSTYGGSHSPQILAPDSAIEGTPSIKIYAVYTALVKGDQFAKNVGVKAHTEYTSHKNGRVEAPAVTIDISKTLFDKETDDESTPDFPGSPIFDDPSGGKV